MGPPEGARLACGAAVGKAMREMPRSQPTANAPVRRDRRERLKDKAALLQSVVRDGERARTKLAAAPQADVEVENPRCPMLSATAAEIALNGFDASKHIGRLELTFDQCDGVGEVSAGATDRCVEHDRRGIEQAE